MNQPLPRLSGFTWTAKVAVFFLVWGVVCAALAQQPVRVDKQSDSYILQNAYLRAEISKVSGDLVSLKYNGLEMMSGGRDHGYWEQNPSGAANLSDGLSIDPASNGGERAEVYIRGVANGKDLARTSSGSMICDMEIRYSLGRNDRGIYTYAIFSHHSGYPKTEIGESRFAIKLNGSVFDWLSVDPKKNFLVPSGSDWKSGEQLNMKEARKIVTGPFAGKVEHKYDYSSDQFDNRAFGWSSTRQHIGLFMINPSTEYLSGGPTKVELTCHLGDNGPIVLDYWRSTHYGGSNLELADNEEWSKVVGPIYVYLSQGETPQAIFADARQEAERQKALWPYSWVHSADYPIGAQRSTVNGKIVIQDEQSAAVGRVRIGLIPPDETDGGWQTDAKSYQFWTDAGKDGSFVLTGVRPGKYALCALADGVLGEYDGASVVVRAGASIDLGSLHWTPLRYGKQLWDIGIPNRNATEFFMGNDSNHWGMYLLYGKYFPKDVDYWIGKSDYRKDWYFEEVPNIAHGENIAKMAGGETNWKIHFTLPEKEKGTAILRVGISGVGARHVFVAVNGKQVGDLAPLQYNATINRDGNQGTWSEHDVSFPAKEMKAGENLIELKVPGGNVMSGVIYDYLRLELDESGKYTPGRAASATKEEAATETE
jgi:rhamnogalacturonan endolyase